MTVRLRGRLPKGRPNGLELLTDELRTHPDRSRYIVAIVAPTAIVENLDPNAEPYTVELELLAVEVDSTDSLAELADLLERLHSARTGIVGLPFGDPPSPPAGVDPATGEIVVVTVAAANALSGGAGGGSGRSTATSGKATHTDDYSRKKANR